MSFKGGASRKEVKSLETCCGSRCCGPLLFPPPLCSRHYEVNDYIPLQGPQKDVLPCHSSKTMN